MQNSPNKNIIITIAVLTLVILIGGVLFLSKTQTGTTPRSHLAASSNAQSTDSNSKLPKPPNFTLPKYDGSGDVNLESLYNDKPTVIQFWATWCEFCRREFPVTNAIVASQKDKINYLAVNFSREERNAVGDYIKELRLDPTVLTFVMDDSGAVGRAYGVTGTPVHVFIKKGGEVSLFQIGYMTPQKMKEEIEKIL